MTISTTSKILTLSNRYNKTALNNPQSHPQVQDYAHTVKHSNSIDGLQMLVNCHDCQSEFDILKSGYSSEYIVLCGSCWSVEAKNRGLVVAR